jgi:hypothetical protein
MQLLEYLFDEATASCTCGKSSSNRVGDSNANLTKGKDVENADDSISIIDIGKDKSNGR